jgi:uncharacterized protein (DUF58 family)
MTAESRHDALRRIELAVLRRLDGILQGDYEGLIPGHGSELGETRVYEAGDDVRRIDWNVTARTTLPHVRDTIADRELETTLVVDLTGSMAFGTRRWEKRDLAIAAAAAMGYLAQRGGNRVGGLLISGGTPERVPARSGRRHLYGLVARMQETPRSETRADLATGLRAAERAARRRGLIVVASDFLDAGPWWEPLRVLAGRHDVICLEVIDPIELALPDIGTIPVRDAETGRTRWLDTGSRALREGYARAGVERAAAVRAAVRSAGADHVRLRTDGDWVRDLVRHVAVRRRGRYTGRRP